MNKISTSILVVGAGPAGLAAASAASRHAKVTIIDDNPHAGGQIWRASKGKIGNRSARRLISEIESRNVELIAGAQVFNTTPDNSILAEAFDGTIEVSYNKLVVATGARERFPPFSAGRATFAM